MNAATPRGIAATLRDPANGDAAVPYEQMQRDSQLASSLHCEARPRTGPRHGDILLTGATGFFGQHVLRALLREPVATHATIHCLVRAEDDLAANQRIRAALAATNTTAGDRIRVVRGDVAQAGFGLPLAAQTVLGRQLDRIVHVAAHVDFLRPYAALRSANVLGTHNVLAFCAANDLALHHVSSIGVFSDPRAAALQTIEEDIEIQRFDRPLGGYAQSKWVSERLVANAMEQGVRATIHRPGRLVADSEFGRGNAHDFVTSLLLLARDLKRVPSAPGLAEQRVDVTPVDLAARDLVHLIDRPESLGGTFHLVHDKPPTVGHLLESWRNNGWTLQECSWRDFCRAANTFLARHPDHPATPLAAFLLAEAPPSMRPEPGFSRTRTRAMLDGHVAPMPPVDTLLVRLWMEELARTQQPLPPLPPDR